VSPRERIQIDRELISEAEWTAAFDAVHAAAEALLAKELIEAHPSFFETITAMAFLAFATAKADIVVLETGLGGRLDGTNIIVPEVAVITQIDFDHEAFLGSSIESIAAEKAGIIKADRPIVFSAQRPEAFGVLEKKAIELNAPVWLSSAWRVEGLELHRHGSRFTLVSDTEIQVECPLAGAHQVENARTAAAALTLFGLAPVVIAEGIRSVTWPGRLEHVSTNPDIILDGAHNPAGAKALAAYIKEFFAGEPIRIVYGAMRDKAVDEVTNTLFPLAAEVILTAPDQPRALNPETLAEAVEHPNLRIATTFADALTMMKAEPMTTFITGSLFLVGEASSVLAERSEYR
jgi:dihydrofolate synthase/folylpolyglutamate synthase